MTESGKSHFPTLLWLALLLSTPIAVCSEQSIEAGRAIAANRNQGNCFSCHYVEGAEMTGNTGPALIQMQARYPRREVLRAQIADPRVGNPNTVMPPYGAHGILSEQEIDQVVDFLLSL